MSEPMDKTKAGLIAMTILAAMQMSAWVMGIDGAVTGTIAGLMGLIAGAVFGFGYGLNKGGGTDGVQ
jgi:hypothetical protein